MEDVRPIICTLTDADLRDRQQAWAKVGAYAQGSAEIPGGLAFVFAASPGVYDSLRKLVALEGECCPWMDFELQNISGEVNLKVTAAGADGERGVRETFAPLAAGTTSAPLDPKR